MTRLNLTLFAILLACALGVVTAQHKARKLFVELEQERREAKRLDVEWGQLQLEQSTWATHARIERLASSELGMRLPLPSQVRVVRLPPEGREADSR
ncbi:cell division protein FtsL [Pelomicrobium methylotrophicum]|uniref:Cell division protein FtsL n=1 Tax=Pelomicrobium methylotrophicum TaxID=2602750 RepID=A0A5C7ELG1_9PROT|nr:cell division protein FtsL [Pelomicrobium methylotrophicum]TXF13180.1 cell division protein FtsL [Pelomicrobium methylotrophicum]